MEVKEMADKKNKSAKNETPRRSLKKTEKLFAVSFLAKKEKVPGWELAALRKDAGWTAGKHVTEKEFKAALGAFRKRPQGS